MSSLLLLLPTSKYGYGGKKPAAFDLGPNSTLDYQSSLNGTPAFTSYADAYLRTKQPTQLSLGGKTPAKYLDNPPQ